MAEEDRVPAAFLFLRTHGLSPLEHTTVLDGFKRAGVGIGVSPDELQWRLHELLEERQQEQIEELELALESTKQAKALFKRNGGLLVEGHCRTHFSACSIFHSLAKISTKQLNIFMDNTKVGAELGLSGTTTQKKELQLLVFDCFLINLQNQTR
ncbi:hypothetical protein Syun_025270 [Stephania yunnanensis]|uniref:Uncharacterized protein n=1 Tax=Stephania yunnanensis TaxID=152371 RepID=A0AAP0ETZ6_9MAGN